MRKLAVLLALVLLPLASARAQSCPGVAPWVFADVSASHAFCTYVTWMAQNNVTLGCRVIDPNTREYCPDDFVTRLQMAAFMNRLGTALFPLTCAAGQVMKWNGAAWTCSDDNIGGSGGGGTVTSVLAGTGLQASPNPIVGAGSINLAPGYQLPQSCANGQVPKSNGTGGWTCGTDNAGTGAVTSLTAGIGITLTPNPITTTGTIAVNTTTMQQRVSGTCAVGSSIRAIAADGTVTCETDDTGPANAFVQGGNALGATAVVGTTDNQSLDIRANNARVMRYEPNAISPNVIGGSPANSVTAGVRGATIAGGGVPAGNTDPDFNNEAPNRVTDVYGTVGGGFGNRAGDDAGTTIDHTFATVGGGASNIASGNRSTVGGGEINTASGSSSTVAGGNGNSASGFASTVAGGSANTASGAASTVGAGQVNTASGSSSTVAGGMRNIASGDYSWAAGRRAKTQTADATPVPHDGAFVWADSSDLDFRSTANNEFAVRATGGARFVTAIDGTGNPTRTARINPNAELEFGSNERQMLNLWAAQYGVGVQAFTMYFRTDGGYSWHRGGVHNDAANNPGGGTELMRLQSNGTLLVTGGTVGTLSDRAAKRDFTAIDPALVLEKVVGLPLAEWSYDLNPQARHIGPTSQDFREAFGLGDDDKSIATVDADGVALAAIKGLNAKLEARDTELAALRRDLAELRRRLDALSDRAAAR